MPSQAFCLPVRALSNDMVRRTRLLSAVVEQVAHGSGAQRLPPQLHAIDVEGVQARGGNRTSRQAIKTLLPRLKYAYEALAVNVHWVPPRGTDKRNGVRPPPSSAGPGPAPAGEEQDGRRTANGAATALDGQQQAQRNNYAARLRLHFSVCPRLRRGGGLRAMSLCSSSTVSLLSADGLPTQEVSLGGKKSGAYAQ